MTVAFASAVLVTKGLWLGGACLGDVGTGASAEGDIQRAATVIRRESSFAEFTGLYHLNFEELDLFLTQRLLHLLSSRPSKLR